MQRIGGPSVVQRLSEPSLLLARSASDTPAADPAPSTSGSEPQLDAAWTWAVELFNSGEVGEYVVKASLAVGSGLRGTYASAPSPSAPAPPHAQGYNRGGLRVEFRAPGSKSRSIYGFVPFTVLDTQRIPAGRERDQDYCEAVAAALVGRKIRAKVVRVDVPARSLILSERAVSLDAAIAAIEPGAEVSVVVKNITDLGAFCTIQAGPAQGTDGEQPG